MKNVRVLGAAALVLLLLGVFTGCPTEDNSPPPELQTAKMIFADTDKEFTINENLEFNVHFVNAISYTIAAGTSNEITFSAPKGSNVDGTIETDNVWDDNPITGEIKTLTSDNPSINSGLGLAVGMAIKLTYTKDGNDEIDGVTVEFPLGELAAFAGKTPEEVYALLAMTGMDPADIPAKITDIMTGLEFLAMCNHFISGTYTLK